MAVAAVDGLQGTSWSLDRHHVIATAKHFAVHGQPEGGTNTAPGNYSEPNHSRAHFCTFSERLSKKPPPLIAVASYNEIDGVPSHINHWLLDTVLRHEWGFQRLCDIRWRTVADAGRNYITWPPTKLKPRVKRSLPEWISICPMARCMRRWLTR